MLISLCLCSGGYYSLPLHYGNRLLRVTSTWRNLVRLPSLKNCAGGFFLYYKTKINKVITSISSMQLPLQSLRPPGSCRRRPLGDMSVTGSTFNIVRYILPARGTGNEPESPTSAWQCRFVHPLGGSGDCTGRAKKLQLSRDHTLHRRHAIVHQVHQIRRVG